jgi:hypothetical protein
MAKLTLLTALFKNYRDAIQSNAEFRKTLNKEVNHYYEDNLKGLLDQIRLIGKTREQDFQKKYGQALATLAQSGMSNVTFTKISGTLRSKFLDHFTELKDLGVETGHLDAVLTKASKQKFEKIALGTSLEIKENREIESLTEKDLQDVAKTIALITSYTKTLEQLDQIQDRRSLIAFLKKSSTFKEAAKSKNLTTLDNISDAITAAFTPKNGAGFAELGEQILKQSILTVQIDSTINMARTITSKKEGIGVTFEIAAVNGLKGNISQSIKTAFTAILDKMMQDPDGLPKVINEALEKSFTEPLTKQAFLELFPNVSASKTMIQALTDNIVETIKTGKITPYSSTKKLPSVKLDKLQASIKTKPIKIDKLKVRPIKTTSIFVNKPSLNLSNLQNLINASLVEQIKRNMGRGERRDVLNLRSGRFAESVKVERMSQSREGMITAFYSYMKNPYATFSQGGAQDTPKSRDPKLLIAKSIREIAAEQVANRLRSVSV